MISQIVYAVNDYLGGNMPLAGLLNTIRYHLLTLGK
jgi:hypothetical protein